MGDVNGDGTADGTWVTTGYTWSASTSSNCESGSRVGYTLDSSAGDQNGVLKNHVWVPKPLGYAAISQAWSTAGNLQCCRCAAATGSLFKDSQFANFDSQSTCETANGKAREGALVVRRRWAVLHQGRRFH